MGTLEMLKEENILLNLIERYPKLEVCQKSIWNAYEVLCRTYEKGGKLLLAGNGGSAADSEHIVGELMKGFIKRREIDEEERAVIMGISKEFGAVLCENLQKTLPAIALSGHIALSTAFSNDVNSALVFAQQLYGYGKKNDIFMGITTSGNSENILYAVIAAKARGMNTIALTGEHGGKIKEMADITIMVPETITYKIQELHLPVYHTLCLMLEERFFG